jgi:hypothetical protein
MAKHLNQDTFINIIEVAISRSPSVQKMTLQEAHHIVEEEITHAIARLIVRGREVELASKREEVPV